MLPPHWVSVSSQYHDSTCLVPSPSQAAPVYCSCIQWNSCEDGLYYYCVCCDCALQLPRQPCSHTVVTPSRSEYVCDWVCSQRSDRGRAALMPSLGCKNYHISSNLIRMWSARFC